MRIMITGAEGFIARNLRLHLHERGYDDVILVTRATLEPDLVAAAAAADFVFHLAGVNRPREESEFIRSNVGFTERVCQALASSGRTTPVAYASTTQAALDNPYGRSKRAAEDVLARHGQSTGAPIYVLRLTNVFGKWCRPHYNSVVATFCHQIARGLPITVHDGAARLRLLYVDDLVDVFLKLLDAPPVEGGAIDARPVYETTVGELADALRSFADSRTSLIVPEVGSGYLRALYATFVSYLPPDSFAYEIPCHSDARGTFVEMLKTANSGQVSYFTARPGATRGGHYHHTKTEKFLVVRGKARFRFRSIVTDEAHELTAEGGSPRIVESVPGWVHDITNVGDDELVVMLWANEIFDRSRPDTVAATVAS